VNLDPTAALELLRTGLLVDFQITATDVRAGVDEAMIFTRVELQLGGENSSDEADDDQGANDVAWAAFGFLFTVAALSFNDARPRGISHMDLIDGDEFTVADFFAHLRYERGALDLSVDYLRGRCVKTDVKVRPDGSITIQTRGRGDAVLRWLDRIQGKKTLEVIPGVETPPADTNARARLTSTVTRVEPQYDVDA
jgi:hypothetical protein